MNENSQNLQANNVEIEDQEASNLYGKSSIFFCVLCVICYIFLNSCSGITLGFLCGMLLLNSITLCIRGIIKYPNNKFLKKIPYIILIILMIGLLSDIAYDNYIVDMNGFEADSCAYFANTYYFKNLLKGFLISTAAYIIIIPIYLILKTASKNKFSLQNVFINLSKAKQIVKDDNEKKLKEKYLGFKIFSIFNYIMTVINIIIAFFIRSDTLSDDSPIVALFYLVIGGIFFILGIIFKAIYNAKEKKQSGGIIIFIFLALLVVLYFILQ